MAQIEIDELDSGLNVAVTGVGAREPEHLTYLISQILRTCILAHENDTSALFLEPNGSTASGVATTLMVAEGLTRFLEARLEHDSLAKANGSGSKQSLEAAE